MSLRTKKMKEWMFLISFSIFLYWGLNNFDLVKAGFSKIMTVFKPLIIGFIIAFLFNIPMSAIEKNIRKRSKKLSDKKIRGISYILSLLLFILIIILITFIIVPGLIDTSKQIAEDFPKYWIRVERLVMENSNLNQFLEFIDFDSLYLKTYDFFKTRLVNWIKSTFLVVSGVISSVVSLIIGLILSVYMLLEKDNLRIQAKRITYVIFNEERANKIFATAKMSQEVFTNFFTGQILESTILGLIFFVTMLIFKIPYAPIVSVSIGITSLIPTVGSFLGCFIGIILITVANYKKTLLFIILFLIIQQIEGNLIYPKVVGKASGLSSMWVMIAITLGGSIMGMLGIILFVPLFSIISKLLNEYIDRRLEEKEIFLEIPKNS